MKNFYIVFVIFVFFTSDAFGYHCYFRPYSGDIRVADINGRQIYTLFSTHLLNESERFHTALDSAIDISEAITIQREFLFRNVNTINSEKSDFRQISSLLTSRKIDWIGIEQYPNKEATEGSVQMYRQFKETVNLLHNMVPSSIWNQEDTDDLLYALFPTEIKLLAEYPNDIVLDGTNGIKVVSLEDKDVFLRIRELDTAIKHRETLLLNYEEGNVFIDFILAYIEEDTLSLINSQHLVEEFLKSQRVENPEIIGEIEAYVDAWNEEIIGHQERDEFVVDSILAQEGNGVVLRGSAHQENVESGLTKACLGP